MTQVKRLRETARGKAGTVVPDHKELKIGTLKNVLSLAGVDEEKFSKLE